MINLLKTPLIISILVAITALTACGGNRPSDIAPLAAASAPAPTAPTEPAATQVSPVAPPPVAASAIVSNSLVVSYTLKGGIMGFCDELNINAAGAYTLRSCRQPESQGDLPKADLDSLAAWQKNLADFTLAVNDDPMVADGMSSSLVFNGQGVTPADETQQKIIYDWANGLLVRLRPQPIPSPTPEPIAVGPGGFCPDIQRPAVLVIDFTRPGGLTLVDPNTQATCNLQLHQPPYGRIATAAGSIFYPIYDETAKTVTLWQLTPTGEQKPLPFTQVDMAEFGPYNFAVSSDGQKVAWARAIPNLEVDPPLYRNDLWVANLDGSNQAQLLNQAEYERRYVEPVAFSPDKNSLFYTSQPDGLGGTIFSFGGRYDNLYNLSTSGGDPRLIYACPPENAICIGDITPDGAALAYVQPGQGVAVIDLNGQPLGNIAAPNTGFIGSPVFGPTGQLAFVSAVLTEGSEQEMPRPNPGAISLVAPPYTAQPQTLLSDNSVTTVWDWVDDNRLIYGALDQESNVGTALLGLDGQTMTLSPNFAVAVLR